MHHYLLTSYNHAAYIEDCLASICALYADQSDFQAQARLWLLDDASCDDTWLRLQALQPRYANLKLYRNAQNLGVGATRNRLLDYWRRSHPAADDFLVFVDGDDLLTTASLHSRLALFQAEPALDAVGGQLGKFFDAQPEQVIAVDSFALHPEILRIASLFECHFYIGNAMFRAQVFLHPERRFAEIPSSEDWLFFSQQQLNKKHVPQITLLYRQHDHNLSSKTLDEQTSFALRQQVRQAAFAPLGWQPSAADCRLLDRISYLSLRMRWLAPAHTPVPVLTAATGFAPHLPPTDAVQNPALASRSDLYLQYDASLRLPWFSPLAEQPDIAMAWPALRSQLHSLFAHICKLNRRQNLAQQGQSRTPFHAELFSSYCAGLLACADLEISLMDKQQARCAPQKRIYSSLTTRM